ncbi:hypothetical protein AWB75_06679 [Caballeronia catudaia]|uniref:Uncharacterized protein n=1 Tax=Caballeronia catudaia TaxID=1777136 RepID=A0A158DFU5_9BURK|nr:hypothetical protein [Caballeronia catudaia]SAK93471.1 hypothetical protein AWB75_06679 [Caballeronia catudaia]
MQVLEALKQAVKACADVVKWGAGIQEPARKALAKDLKAICMKCDAAYEAVLARLVPVKEAFSKPMDLAAELRAFAADGTTRANFKPEQLCGEVDELLIRLSSNLDPLKYSIDFRRIDDVRQYLVRFGNFDGAIFQSYDELVAELDRIATEIQTSASDQHERARYAEHVIQDFEKDLRATQSAVRDAKNQMINLI